MRSLPRRLLLSGANAARLPPTASTLTPFPAQPAFPPRRSACRRRRHSSPAGIHGGQRATAGSLRALRQWKNLIHNADFSPQRRSSRPAVSRHASMSTPTALYARFLIMPEIGKHIATQDRDHVAQRRLRLHRRLATKVMRDRHRSASPSSRRPRAARAISRSLARCWLQQQFLADQQAFAAFELRPAGA